MPATLDSLAAEQKLTRQEVSKLRDALLGDGTEDGFAGRLKAIETTCRLRQLARSEEASREARHETATATKAAAGISAKAVVVAAYVSAGSAIVCAILAGVFLLQTVGS